MPGDDPRQTTDVTPATNGQRPASKKFYVQLAEYSQLAFVLPACTVVGWLVGAGLDRWLHTTWLYLVGLLLGIAAGFVELVRTAMRSEKKG
jgi:F0F1-type ATP synthase assembly protein I